MKNTTETLFKISIISFKEDDCFFVYCPSLDLTGYGDTEKQASESFNIVLGEYIRYTTEHGTLIADLEEHGWRMNGKGLTPPKISKSLQKNKDFDNIVNNYDFKKQNLSLSIPV